MDLDDLDKMINGICNDYLNETYTLPTKKALITVNI